MKIDIDEMLLEFQSLKDRVRAQVSQETTLPWKHQPGRAVEMYTVRFEEWTLALAFKGELCMGAATKAGLIFKMDEDLIDQLKKTL